MRKAVGWILLLVVAGLVPAAAGQDGPPIQVTVESVAWQYGPETWKGDPFHVQSLGLHLDLTLRLERDGQPLPSNWEYTATLQDHAQEVTGQVDAAGAGRLTVRFDVDGSRAGPFGSPVTPLTPGTWTLRIDAASPGDLPGQTRFEGWGSATLSAGAISVQALEHRGPDDGSWQPLPGGPLPAGVLPSISEVGGGPTWFADPLLTTADSWRATLDAGQPGTTVEWTAWVPAPFVPFLTPPFEAIHLGTTMADADGMATLTIGATGATHLMVVSAVVDHPDGGGAAAFALGTGDTAPTITALAPPAPGAPGPLGVTATGAGLGSAYALDGPRLLSQGRFAVPTGPGESMALLDPTPIRAAAVPAYRLLVMADNLGTGYAGHQAIERGLAVDWHVPVLGVDRETQLGVTLRSLTHSDASAPGLSLPINVTLSFHGDVVGHADLDLPAGGTITRTWPVTPQAEGAAPLVLHVDTGDLRFTDQRTESVVSGDEHDRQTAPWYSPGRYIPAPLPVLVVLGAALLARTRKR